MINHISNFDYVVLAQVFKNLSLAEIENNKSVCKHFCLSITKLFENFVLKENIVVLKELSLYAKKFTLIKTVLKDVMPFMIGSVFMGQKTLCPFMEKLNQQIAKEISQFSNSTEAINF